MSYQLKVIKDYPIGFWPLDESSGSIASDISGCGNNGTYTGSPAANMLPIIPGGISGTRITNTAYVTFPITKDFYGATVGAGFGTKYTSDNDFTLEVWINQSIESSNETPLLADATNNIGLFWDNGDIVFKVSATESIRRRVLYSKKSMHLVAVYSVGAITLYIDSAPVASKSLSNFKFTNTTINLQSGPTAVSGDTFIVDAPAVYRYGLNETSIRRHYVDGNITTPAIHVVYPDKGILFSGTDANIKAQFDYSYPVNKPWSDFVDSNTYYDSAKKYITFYQTDTTQSKSFVINDFLAVPQTIGLITSKVEWRNDLGITVESSVDGTTYVACTNGQPIPQYSKGSFNTTGKLYIRITMSTTDASKFLPRLSFFCITFYSDTTVYADNYGDKITSNSDYYLGSLNYPVLSRHYMNGIRAKNGAEFDMTTAMSVKSVEMLFTPLTLAANTLIYSSGGTTTRFAWNGSGAISKANIAKVYINNVDISTATNISSYLVEEEPHYIVLVFTTPITGNIQFNYESTGGPSNLYNNIAIYPSELTVGKVETHYELYTGKPVESITESAITLTELQPAYYNNDWIVLQSI
ncbi:MAG: hypothetical protein EBW12_06580 [Actinobacteria bacterium]|nr:hypothetical protein [Actinomycetota bacterium]